VTAPASASRAGGRRAQEDETETRTLDSYDGDEPFRSALEVEESTSRKRGSGRRKRSTDRQAQQTTITELFEPGGDHSGSEDFVIPDVGEETDVIASPASSAASATRSRPTAPAGGARRAARESSPARTAPWPSLSSPR